MRRHPLFALTVVIVSALLAVSLFGCSSGGSSGGTSTGGTSSTGSSGGTSAGGTTIVEKDFAFNPSNVTVKVGDTITFTNEDPTDHNVKIGTTVLGAQAQGESKTWKADKAGTYQYSCIIHPTMTGVITVQ